MPDFVQLKKNTPSPKRRRRYTSFGRRRTLSTSNSNSPRESPTTHSSTARPSPLGFPTTATLPPARSRYRRNRALTSKQDIVTRYATQTGHYVERRFGWDCHGLPVEYEIDKELGIQGKEDYEKVSFTRDQDHLDWH